MSKTRTARLALVAALSGVALLLAACGGGSSASEAPADQPASEAPAAPAENGTPVAVTVGETDVSHQYMKLDSTTVPAGTVTFTITNDGVKTHEFVILEAPATGGTLDMIGDEVSEDAYTAVDEVEDIEAGATATLTVDLKPGHYALICNIKGHYRMGMRNDLTVS